MSENEPETQKRVWWWWFFFSFPFGGREEVKVDRVQEWSEASQLAQLLGCAFKP